MPKCRFAAEDDEETMATDMKTSSAADRADRALRAVPELTITRSDRPITILLVDDDADCRMLIRDAIAECKVSNDVHEVSTGEEALQFLHRQGEYADAPRPGLVYLDIEMPGLDGLETLRRIRASQALREIPVVMMTGVCGEEQMRHAAELGANSYTIKPANAEQFLRTVLASTRYWLTIHQQPDRHVPPEMARR
jgi:CheY-like chemotaxis protein